MDKEQRAVCGDIADYYGKAKQEVQAVQELSELICLLTRRPDQRGVEYTSCLIGELADVAIMVEQIRQLHGITLPEISDRIDYKLHRQQERIKFEEAGGGITV